MLQIEKEIAKLPKNFIVALLVRSDKYEDMNTRVLKYLINKKRMTGSYVNVNRPYVNMVDSLRKKKIDPQKLFFVDCITKKIKEKPVSAKNCVYIDSPQDLTELSLELHNSLGKGDGKFLFIDTLSTLSIYNNPDMMLKFVHYITGKMRIWGLSGVIVALSDEIDSKIVAELNQFCDKVIKI